MERTCDICGTTYLARRATSRYCSGACRAKASRKGPPPAPVTRIAAPSAVGGIEAATLDELTAAGRVGSSAGQRALALARLLDAPPQGSLGAVAGWAREHGSAMATALAGAVTASATRSALDEIKARRDAKRGA